MTFKKQRQSEAKELPQTEKYSRLEMAKHRLALFLQIQSDRISIQFKKALLILLGLAIAALSIGSIINAVSTQDNKGKLKVDSLVIPNIDINRENKTTETDSLKID